MAASQTSLPQGFSVYQPALGAQLQFFPAVGSQELDDMINAYAPGPASIQEKRASVSLDFLEYAQVTGQAFKFYPVAASPAQDSVSSFNVSPVTPSWDWSQASGASSRSSAQPKARKASAASAAPATSRHQTTDFSHLPGMQIMTKDGRDVTNSASRGSKTKEQRDHAHLMRVIKACDACRRRKTRCDPSHKKRTAVAQAQPQAASRSAKKARTASQLPPAVAPSILTDEVAIPAMPFDLDSSFALNGFEDFDFSAAPAEDNWDQFLQYPADLDEDYDFFLDPKGLLSPEGSSFTSSSSSSASPPKSLSPTSSQEAPGVSPTEMLNPELQTASPQLPFLDQGGTIASYTDFNLFSPQSSFSEDDLMIDIQSSSSRVFTPDEQLDPGDRPPTRPPYDGAMDLTSPGELAMPLDSPGADDLVPASEYDPHFYDRGRYALGDATGGLLPESSISSTSQSGSAFIDLSMRLLGEARTYGGEEHARETVNLSPSSSSGLSRGQDGTVNLSPSSSSGLARGQAGTENHSPSSLSGPVLGQLGTESTAALRVEDQRGLSSIRRANLADAAVLPHLTTLTEPGRTQTNTFQEVQAPTVAATAAAEGAANNRPATITSELGITASGTTANVRGTLVVSSYVDMNSVPGVLATATSTGLSPTIVPTLASETNSVANQVSAGVLSVDERQASIGQAFQTRADMPDDRGVGTENLSTATIQESTVSSRIDTMGEDVVAELAIYDLTVRGIVSTVAAYAMPIFQGVAAGCTSTSTSTMAPLSSTAVLAQGVFTLALSAMVLYGANPLAVFAWAVIASAMACVTVTPTSWPTSRNPVKLDTKRNSSEHDGHRRARSSGLAMSALRSRASHFINASPRAATMERLLAF